MSRLKDKLNRLHHKKDEVTTKASTDSYVESQHSQTIDVDLAQGYYTDKFSDPYSSVYEQNNIGLFTNEFGSFLLKRMEYPVHYQHGMYQLNQLEGVAEHLKSFCEEASVDKVNLEELLFFDLETTGLGTGTGNIPFMAGIAFYKNGQFIIEQMVVRNMAEERALLAYLHRKTASYNYLVTYNGKTFDWPLLVTRYMLNGMREELWQPKHIDLLHPSRFIWRNTLQSCKLSYIEEARLGIHRLDDLPGSEAPDRYFKYLADNNPEHLLDVYKHNELDMLTLATLLTRFAYLLSGENVKRIIQLPNEPEEMIRTGLWLEKMNVIDSCEELFSIALELPSSYAPTLYTLALRDKQRGNEKRAIELFQNIVESEYLPSTMKVDSLIHLAIYEEHTYKNLGQALSYTNEALQLMIHLELSERESRTKQSKHKKMIMELDKRKLRLNNKLEKLAR